MHSADGERHDLDAVSLMGGLLIGLVAGLFLLTDLTGLSLEGRWAGPVLLLAVGAAGLLATLRPRASSPGDPDRDE